MNRAITIIVDRSSSSSFTATSWGNGNGGKGYRKVITTTLSNSNME
jgi:hypothetical protein